jgi:UDP-glucose 4-epimerase
LNSVLVTGASGLLGVRLVRTLLADGQHVTAVARRPMPADLRDATNLRWAQRDLLARRLSAEDVRGVTTVFHLAALKEPGPGQTAADLIAANERLTVEVFQAAAGVTTTFVHASTQMVYGDPGSTAVAEEHPLLGARSTPYACSKVNAENWLRCLHAGHGARVVVLRFTGFLEGGGAIDYMIDTAVRDEPITLLSRGAVKRDYLPASAASDAFIAAARFGARANASRFEVFNIGAGDPVPSNELAEVVRDAVGSRSEIVLSDKPAPRKDFVFDIRKARDELGFRPAPLRDAVRQYALERQRIVGVKSDA